MLVRVKRPPEQAICQHTQTHAGVDSPKSWAHRRLDEDPLPEILLEDTFCYMAS